MIPKRPVLLVNPHAGPARARGRIPHLEKAFLAAFPQGRILLSSPVAADLRESDLLVVYGGDGTLARLLSLPLSPDLPVLLLPGGTGNVLSRYLAVPFDPARPGEIFSRLGRARPLAFSPGMADSVRFCLMAGAGWDGVAAQRVRGKRRLGPLSYYLAGLAATFSGNLPRISLKIQGNEGRVIVREGIVWALISRLPPYFGPFRVAGAGAMAETPFMVTLVRDSGLRVPGAFLEMLPGGPSGIFSERLPAREVELCSGSLPQPCDSPGRSTDRVPCQADGEAIPSFSRVRLSPETLALLSFRASDSGIDDPGRVPDLPDLSRFFSPFTLLWHFFLKKL